jgi:hypothetical protein
MRHFPSGYRFSRWDGSQKLPLDADEIMAALADDLMEYGDLRWAMRNLMSRGMQIPQGGYMQESASTSGSIRSPQRIPKLPLATGRAANPSRARLPTSLPPRGTVPISPATSSSRSPSATGTSSTGCRRISPGRSEPWRSTSF